MSSTRARTSLEYPLQKTYITVSYVTLFNQNSLQIAVLPKWSYPAEQDLFLLRYRTDTVSLTVLILAGCAL